MVSPSSPVTPPGPAAATVRISSPGAGRSAGSLDSARATGPASSAGSASSRGSSFRTRYIMVSALPRPNGGSPVAA